MVVIGGKAGLDVTGTVEVFNPVDDSWQTVPELTLREPRYSFCAVPGKPFFQNILSSLLCYLKSELTVREPRYSFCAVPGKALFPPLFVVFALLFKIRAHAQGAMLQLLRSAG